MSRLNILGKINEVEFAKNGTIISKNPNNITTVRNC